MNLLDKMASGRKRDKKKKKKMSCLDAGDFAGLNAELGQ